MFYKRRDSSFVKINEKEIFINGSYHNFSTLYPNLAILDIINGNYNLKNTIGFYAIKLNNVNQK